jgi:hypothetical protein
MCVLEFGRQRTKATKLSKESRKKTLRAGALCGFLVNAQRVKGKSLEDRLKTIAS